MVWKYIYFLKYIFCFQKSKKNLRITVGLNNSFVGKILYLLRCCIVNTHMYIYINLLFSQFFGIYSLTGKLSDEHDSVHWG